MRTLFSFTGRIGRKTYWLFSLAAAVITVSATALDAAMMEAAMMDTAMMDAETDAGIPVFTLLFSVALIWPWLAISAKRWHDRDKSAWWILIAFVPAIGPLWALVENGFLPGTQGDNRFGPSPVAP